MPLVNIKLAVDGREETLSEFLCDWPGCPNVAVEVIGVVRELRLVAALCPEHARASQIAGTTDRRRPDVFSTDRR